MLNAVNGFAIPELHSVVQIFKKQLQFSGGGSSLCIYHHSEPVVDIWAGIRNTQGDPWMKDTPTMSFSTTKGVLSTLLHIVLQEAHIDYETQVSHIWPSFKQHNKGHITIRQILCHESALFNVGEHIEHIQDIYDWDHMVWSLAKSKPSIRHLGEPSYHGLTYGWLLGELIHRLTGLSPGQFLDTELRSIMGRNNYIGAPTRALGDISTLIQNVELCGAHQRFTQKIQRKANHQLTKLLLKSPVTLCALKPPIMNTLDVNDPQLLMAEIPAMNGVFTARGLAKLYTLFAMPNEEKHLALIDRKHRAHIQTIQSTRRDRVLHVPMNWRLGYHRIFNFKKKAPFGFGHFGYGGSGGWCDPSRHISVGFTLNTLWGSPISDYKMAQLAGEILSSIDKLNINQKKPEHSLNS